MTVKRAADQRMVIKKTSRDHTLALSGHPVYAGLHEEPGDNNNNNNNSNNKKKCKGVAYISVTTVSIGLGPHVNFFLEF